MENWTEKTIDKEVFSQIMKNISPTSFILCGKCGATKTDTPELLKSIVKYVNQHLYSDDESDYEKSFEIMEAILDDIRCWPDEDGFEWLAWISKWPAEYDLRYCVYDTVIFYQNVECGCYLKKSIDQESVYSIRVE